MKFFSSKDTVAALVVNVLLSYVFDTPSSRGNWFSASLVFIGAAVFLGVPVVGLAAGRCLLGEQVSCWQKGGNRVRDYGFRI